MSQPDSSILLERANHFFSEIMPLKFQLRIFQIQFLSIKNREWPTTGGRNRCIANITSIIKPS
jgi:hypothetical protein